MLDAAIGARGEATTLVKDGEPQILFTEFKNTLSCARCIRSSNVFVYNHEVKAPPPDTTDYTQAPAEVDAGDAGAEDTQSPAEPTNPATPEPAPPLLPPAPYYYHDL